MTPFEGVDGDQARHQAKGTSKRSRGESGESEGRFRGMSKRERGRGVLGGGERERRAEAEQTRTQ